MLWLSKSAIGLPPHMFFYNSGAKPSAMLGRIEKLLCLVETTSARLPSDCQKLLRLNGTNHGGPHHLFAACHLLPYKPRWIG